MKVTLKPKMTQKTKDYAFVAILVAPAIIHFLLFWVYVNFDSLTIAFQNEATGEWGFSNFERFFTQFKRDWAADGAVKTSIENTFITAFINMFINEPMLIFATYILFKKYFGHMIFRVGFYIPAIVGTTVSAIMLQYILGATGPVAIWGNALGFPISNEVLQSGFLNNFTTARSTFHITSMLGLSGASIVILTGAFQKIPRDLFDVGKLEGIGIFTEFVYLILPCAWSTIGVMWIMTFASVWGSYNRVLLLTGGLYKTGNFAYYMFSASLGATQGTESYNYPAALGLLLTVVVAPLTLLLRKLSMKLVEPVEF